MNNIIDEEECRMINDLKEIKDVYKEILEKFRNSKIEIQTIKGNLEVLKIKYVENFENWFYEKYGIRVQEHNDHDVNKVSLIILFYFNLFLRINTVQNMSLII
jgi:hypothetical protein